MARKLEDKKEIEKALRIKQIRKELGFTQDEFADRLGLTRSYISQVDSLYAVLSERACSDLCRLFGVNPEWLETGEGDMFSPLKKEEAIANLFSDSLQGSSFKSRLISGLARLSEDDWQQLEKIVDKFIEENEG